MRTDLSPPHPIPCIERSPPISCRHPPNTDQYLPTKSESYILTVSVPFRAKPYGKLKTKFTLPFCTQFFWGGVVHLGGNDPTSSSTKFSNTSGSLNTGLTNEIPQCQCQRPRVWSLFHGLLEARPQAGWSGFCPCLWQLSPGNSLPPSPDLDFPLSVPFLGALASFADGQPLVASWKKQTGA